MINLPNVTLVAVSSIKIPETIRTLEYSMKDIKFGAVKFITDKEFYHSNIKRVCCAPMNNINEYNEFIFHELGTYITTSHCLVIQYDSAVIYPQMWTDEFLEFSYLGAPWPIVCNSYMGNNGEVARVGNGGFSLRDRVVLDTPKKLGWELRQEQSYFSEDGNINCYWRKEFLENGIKYPPVELAARFAYENEVPENRLIEKTFGFHKNIRYAWAKELGL